MPFKAKPLTVAQRKHLRKLEESQMALDLIRAQRDRRMAAARKAGIPLARIGKACNMTGQAVDYHTRRKDSAS